MVLSSGSRLGNYEILAPLGAGGMGVVYLARDPNLGRRLALKVLTGSDGKHAHALARFAQEARSASALNHPNILTVYEIVLDHDPPFIAMELIDGQNLRQLLADGPLPIRKILQIASQVADGLASAHEKGIVHRDLKPENVMLSRDGFVKILDFGLAKLSPLASSEDSTFEFSQPETRPGTVLGTVGYMSPEQANGEEADARSDQFAFGTILYELATGKKAFDRGSAIDTLSAILHDDPEPVERLNARTPAPLRWIIDRCLAKDRTERYESTRDLARELRVIRDRLSETSLSDETREMRWRRVPWRRVGLISAAAMILIALAVTALILRDRPVPAEAVTSPIVEQATRSIAILPFTDLTNTEANRLLGAGIAETISARLSRAEGIQIIPPVLFANDRGTDPTSIGSSFGVELILRGSVQQAENQLRIVWSMVDAKGVQVAGETLNGSPSDLFAIQDRLAEHVFRALALRTNPPARELSSIASQERYLQAVGYLQRYDHQPSVEAAIRILEELDELRESGDVLALLGRAYLSQFRLTRDPQWVEKARSACERAAVLDPESAEVHLSLGELRFQTGEYQAAVHEYQRALAQQPSNAEAVLSLAETFKAMGQPQEAERSYRRAIDMRPRYWAGYNKLGAFYMTLGRYPEATEMFQRVTQLSPDNARGYYNLGALHYLMGDYEEAIASLRRSIAIHPTSSALSNLGTCSFFLGRYPEAEQAYERAIALAPENFELWANLADARRWIGNDDGSRSAYEKAISLARSEIGLNPSNAGAHGTLAVCLAKLGRFDEARVHVEKANAIGAADVNLLYQTAVVWHLIGDGNKAITSLERALDAGYSLSEAERDPEIETLLTALRRKNHPPARPGTKGEA
ncbi:MAG TPA: tetratricopeptide repeat protein [Thermoanaerobaculia bacterium]|nr:tetratricopeptide repeat protein [Thermoanaerobaculia bacterium]